MVVTSNVTGIFIRNILIVIIITFVFAKNIYAAGDLDSLVNHAFKVSLIHLENSVKEIGDTTHFPSYGTKDLKWKITKREDWTSGFYPGCLWYAYEISNDKRFEHWAEQWTNSLEEEINNPNTHDLGFKFMCTSGNGLRFGEKSENDRYKNILLAAAITLSQRYDSTVGCLSSNWDNKEIENSYPVVIDIMMNLELLFWASENGGPTFYKDYAINHAIKTYKDFVRPDGSTYHIVRYDKTTGKVINKGTIQGAGDETTWSRGHAWAIYGMVVAYRYTKDKQFLDYAVKLADYFLKNLHEDHVSPWDFNSDIKTKDVSATCVVTSALFEMIKYIDNDSSKSNYLSEAVTMLSSLCRKPYFLEDKETSCLLDHSTHYLPINSNVDVPAIFADYYFFEALFRYKALTNYNK